jgi:hypothetical protein
MRARRVPDIVASVERQNVRVVVDVELGDPVCGAAGLEGEPQTKFEGMLAFLALFDHLRSRASGQERIGEAET